MSWKSSESHQRRVQARSQQSAAAVDAVPIALGSPNGRRSTRNSVTRRQTRRGAPRHQKNPLSPSATVGNCPLVLIENRSLFLSRRPIGERRNFLSGPRAPQRRDRESVPAPDSLKLGALRMRATGPSSSFLLPSLLLLFVLFCPE